MPRPIITAQQLLDGQNEPDPNEIDELSGPIGLEAEEAVSREEVELEAVDILTGLREMASADPLRWNIERVGEADPEKNGFLARWSTTQLTQERIRDEFGGGTYRIRGVRPNGRYAVQRTVTIAGDAQRKGARVEQSAGFDMQQFFAMMDARDRAARREAQDREQQRELAEERSRKTRNELITILAPIVAPMGTALVTALAGRPVAPIPPMADPVASLKGLAELMVTMQSLVPQAGGGEDSLVSIIKAVAPHAGPVLSALAQRSAALTVAPRPPAPGSQPTQAAPVHIEATPIEVPAAQQVPAASQGPVPHTGVDLNAPSTVHSPERQQMFAQLKPQVDTLVQIAREGQVGATEVADSFFQTTMLRLDDDAYDQLCEFFEDPNSIDHIAVLNTGVREHRAFFETLQNRIKERIFAEAQES